MNLAVRDERLVELMDDPACDPDRLRATLRRFGTINRLVSGWGAVYRRALAPHLASLGRPARVLDIGSGGGDLVVRLAAAARRDGLDVEWTGIDPDPRSHEVALERGGRRRRDVPVRRCGDPRRARAPRSTPCCRITCCTTWATRCRASPRSRWTLSHGLVLHSDIERSRLAYGLYAVGITPFAPGTFLRTDGLRSIRRSYTAAELAAVLDEAMPGAWTVQTGAPFRVLATGRGRG